MVFRDVWADVDFADMGWHDACVYSMSFPQAGDYSLSFDLDYIFMWHWHEEEVSGWEVAPCWLTFNSVSNLKLALSWDRQGDTWIQNITRDNCRPSTNGKVMLWDYVLEMDVGNISFHATGFEQIVRTPPIFSASQSLGREPQRPSVLLPVNATAKMGSRKRKR